MKQILIISFLILSFLALSNCGYKVLDNSGKNNFHIKEINTSGDKRINFKIKNSLIIDSSKDTTKNLILTIDTKKTKQVKEKNIKNQISKYKISLNSSVKINFLEKGQEHKFDVSSSGDFLAADKYSTTLQNEKRLINDLTNDLTDKIKESINLITNDL